MKAGYPSAGSVQAGFRVQAYFRTAAGAGGGGLGGGAYLRSSDGQHHHRIATDPGTHLAVLAGALRQPARVGVRSRLGSIHAHGLERSSLGQSIDRTPTGRIREDADLFPVITARSVATWQSTELKSNDPGSMSASCPSPDWAVPGLPWRFRQETRLSSLRLSTLISLQYYNQMASR